MVVVALGCGVMIVELAWRVLRGPAPAEVRRYLLLGAPTGSALQNVGRSFQYQPNSLIHAAAYFDSHGGVVKEYEYQFATNNMGLVQKADVAPGRASALLLGDSFTEGQGAEPWVEQLAPFLVASGYQPINGGLFGTGFEHWILLHDRLREHGMVITKLIVVLISEDYERAAWNLRPEVLSCLSDYRNCVGDEEFYGLPPEGSRATFLTSLSRYRSARQRLRSWFPATTEAYGHTRQIAAGARDWLKTQLHGGPAIADDVVRARRVRFFAELYGTNVIFVHLPTRDELRDGMDPLGEAARKAIRESHAKFFDGFTRCGLAIGDFHVHDGHPTAAGYSKVAACVREAAREIM